MAQADGSLARLAHRCEGLRQDIFEFSFFCGQDLLADAVHLDAGEALFVRAKYGQVFLFRRLKFFHQRGSRVADAGAEDLGHSAQLVVTLDLE